MNEVFSLHDLSNRTGVELRKLRYCVDHELIPDRTWLIAIDEPGKPRWFDRIGAVYLLCAIRLLESGFRRDAVKKMLTTTELFPKSGRNPLGLPETHDAIIGKSDGIVDFGDDSHMRWRVAKRDSGWMKMGRQLSKDPDFEPAVVTSLNISIIRRAIIGSQA